MDILEEYKSYLKEKKPEYSKATIKMYSKEVQKYIDFAAKQYKEKKIYKYKPSKRTIEKYKRNLKLNGYSIESINMKIRFLSFYESFLIERGIKRNKVITKKIFYKEEKRNVTNISDETYEILIEMAKQDSSKYYLMFILYSKFRISSRKLVRIKIREDIDLKNKEIHIGNRTIEMTHELEKALKKYMKDRKVFLKGYENEYLFVSHIGRKDGKPMQRTSLRRAIQLYFQRLIESDEYYGYWRDNY